MRVDILAVIRAEHQELHAQLASIVRDPGPVGEAAKEVERLLLAHFVREEEFALPPLRVLEDLAQGAVTPDMAIVLPMAQRLRAELPAMRAEHRAVLAALARLRTAADAAGTSQPDRFIDSLTQHVKLEEQVLYPAAVLVGEHLRKRT